MGILDEIPRCLVINLLSSNKNWQQRKQMAILGNLRYLNDKLKKQKQQ